MFRMQRSSRAPIVVAVALSLGACASGHETFYENNPHLNNIALDSGASEGSNTEKKIIVLAGSGDFEADAISLYTDKHLIVIGRSSFEGAIEGPSGAIKQAKKVGATHVLMASKYARTVSGTTTMTVPQLTTSSTRGTVYSGGQVGSYSGTTTTYGTTTSTSSYSVNRYDQQAMFLAPIKPEGLGVMTRVLSPEEKARIGSNKGEFVGAVANGSPAFNADILPGDIIMAVNEKPVIDFKSTKATLRGKNTLTIWRAGKIVQKEVTIPQGRWAG